jgi:hypothetical protein
VPTPQDLARAYDRGIAARWRGDEDDAHAFAAWLATYWVPDAPPPPAGPPSAVSVLGAAGAGIRWYAAGRAVLGYVGGQARGCYRVPLEAVPPAPTRPAGPDLAAASLAAAEAASGPW